MLNKVLKENYYALDIALAWCLNAKNNLQNAHGFSPFQLAAYQNPSLPCAFTDKLPALLMTQHSKIISYHLNIIHKAQEAFTMNESSEKIRRARRHNIRTSHDNIFVTGDCVYYKRASDRRWRGPPKVLGQDGQQVLVKHGDKYTCCHPCCLSLEQSNQQKFSQAQTASSNNSDS